MQRRHYELIADIIRTYAEDVSWPASQAHSYIAQYFADKFEEGQYNFKRDKFLRACGVEDDGQSNNHE